MPYLKTNSAEIFYKTFPELLDNNLSWIILVNGHTRTHSDFNLLGKKLAENNFNILTFDNRGSGKTIFNSISLQDLCDDIFHLMQHLKIEKAHLLGISMGGMICQNFYQYHPDDVRSLILVSTTPYFDFMNHHLPDWGNSKETIMHRLSFYFAKDFLNKNRLVVEGMSKQILEKLNVTGEDNFLTTSKLQAKAIGKFDNRSHLAEIKIPTLIIHGEEDHIVFLEAVEYFLQNISQCEKIIYKNAGHLLLAEKSQNMFEDILSFVQKNN